MTIEKNYKQNNKSVFVFLSFTIAVMLMTIALITTVNASNNSFSAMPEIDNNVVEPFPTPTPRTNRRKPTSDRQGDTSAAVPTDNSVTKPTGKNLSPRQQGNIKQLQADLSAIKEGSTVTPEQKTALKNSLMAMADGATKPNPATVQKFADDLAEALSDGRLSVAEQNQLAKDLEAVMNSANIPEAEVQQAIADAQAILLASGVDKSDVQTLGYDMQQIVVEAKKNVKNATDKARANKPVPPDAAKEKPASAPPSGVRRKRPQ